jgi:predicted TPR repeat methyltransferase
MLPLNSANPAHPANAAAPPLTAAQQQALLSNIAQQVRLGDLVGAKQNCELYCARAVDPKADPKVDAKTQAPAQFWLGVIALRSRDPATARRHFELALPHDKRNAMWLEQSGLACLQLGDLDSAETHYRNALRIEPRAPVTHYNLGVVLQQKRDLAGARRAFETALMQQPKLVPALINLANTCLQLGEIAVAEKYYREALTADANLAEAHQGLASIYQRTRQLADAEKHFIAALNANPALDDCRLDLAELHFNQGRKDAAMDGVNAVLARNPAHELANFRLAQFQGKSDVAMPSQAVEKLYASMAATFDEHLTGRLGYRIPGLLMSALRGWLDDFVRMHARKPNVIDLGCGTGLFGILVRPYAGQLVGTDLSQDMLELASERHVYDQLSKQDVTHYLTLQTTKADLIVATDVLIYINPLKPLFTHASTTLSVEGLFAFSTETPADLIEDFRLESTGRFSHHAHYVERLAAETGFMVTEKIATVIRTENNAPIHGFVFVLKKSTN